LNQYVLTIYQPDGDPPPRGEMEKVMRDIDRLISDVKVAGAWVFNGGLHPPAMAKVVRLKGGKFTATDGPYTESKEHIGGFIIIRAPDLDSALEWARKAARATTLPIEVRPFMEESED
jgi:hypothetical protein